MIVVSIRNVIVYLKSMNGTASEEQRLFTCPTDSVAYDSPWAITPKGFFKLRRSTLIDAAQVQCATKEEIRNVYRTRS